MVMLNGFLLGNLDPTQDTTNFQVPEDILLSDNIIDIFNQGLSSFTLLGKVFDTGGIDSNPLSEVPLPSALLLLGSGLLRLANYRQRKLAPSKLN